MTDMIESLSEDDRSKDLTEIYFILKRWQDGTGSPSAKEEEEQPDLWLARKFVQVGKTAIRRALSAESKLIKISGIIEKWEEDPDVCDMSDEITKVIQSEE